MKAWETLVGGKKEGKWKAPVLMAAFCEGEAVHHHRLWGMSVRFSHTD